MREELNRLAEKISIDYYEYCRIEQELGSLKPETTLDRKVREQIKGLVVVVPDPQLLIAPRWTLLGGTPIQPGKVPTGDVDLASLPLSRDW